MTAVFEGGLISFAALMIAYEAVASLIRGPVAPNLDVGFVLFVGAGAVNGLLGASLVAIGKKSRSAALIADGKHVLTDFLTTVAVILGLGLVRWTGFAALDSLLALAMAVALAATGVPIVRSAIGGLIDAADPELLEKALTAFERHRFPGIIRMHLVRAMRNGRHVHIDGHVVVPEFWEVDEAHARTDEFENRVLRETFPEGEIEFHIDPCYRRYCSGCDFEPCPVRQAQFAGRPPLELTELTSPLDRRFTNDKPQ